MYNNAVSTASPERPELYGAGFHPEYSNSDPMRAHIISEATRAAVSAEERSRYRGIPENSVTHHSITESIRAMINGSDTAGTGSPHSSSAPFGFNLSTVISDLNNPDPFQAFILNPHNSAIVNAMFRAIACKDLPLYLREKELDSWQMEQVRNILGILCKDILPEDKKLFYKLCSRLKKVEGDINKEAPMGKDVAFLLHKYGESPLFRQLNAYLECCRKVWHYYNPGYAVNPSDDVIFTSSSVFCLETTRDALMRLIRPNQVWGDVTSIGYNFEKCCSALGFTINIDPAKKPSAASITETFASVYLNNQENATIPEHYDAESMDSTRSQTAWQRVANIFCCGTE